MPAYYDDWQTENYVCSKCKWQGLGDQCKQGEMFNELYELDCPECGTTLTAITYPTIEESEANWDKVDDADKAMVLARQAFISKAEMTLLRSPDELPEIDADEFVLVWDRKGEDHNDFYTAVRYGRQTVWAETCFYEGIDRYAEVAGILKQKYGTRLKDLVTTERSMNDLYGDKLSAPGIENSIRDRMWLPEPPQKTEDNVKPWLFGPYCHTEYYGPWQTKKFVCGDCGWAGKHDECKSLYHQNFADLQCPNCRKSLAWLGHPDLNKALVNGLQAMFAVEPKSNFQTQLLEAGYGQWLESPDQLPEISDDDVVLVWDDVQTIRGREFWISYGSTIVWREPCFYGCFSRFKTVATILQEKYGGSLKDLVPTRRSCIELSGRQNSIIYRYNDIRGDIWMNRVPLSKPRSCW